MTAQKAPVVTLDVFTNQRYKGNQLAVVEIKNSELSHRNMQIAAREFNFSEIVFLDRRDDSQPPRLHIFTPVNEMDFAGHPVIGTGHVLFRHLLPAAQGLRELGMKTLSIETNAEIPHNIHISSDTPKQNIVDTQPAFAASKAVAFLKDAYPTISIVRGVSYVLVDFTGLQEPFAVVKADKSPTITLDEGWGPSFAGTMFYRIIDTRDEQGTTV